MKKVFIICAVFLLALYSYAESAVKWQTLEIAEDIAASLEELKNFCTAHEVALNDVLWANKISSEEEIKTGDVIFLPENQAEMLAIWQNKGAWEPKALVPVTAGTAARRLLEHEKKTTEPRKNEAAKESEKPSHFVIEASMTTDEKPDEILTSKQESTTPEIPGLMDPIIVLSPKENFENLPMRLVISGDKVEIVQLPKEAMPKVPSVKDLKLDLSGYQSYRPVYTPLPKLKGGNVYNLGNINTNGKMLWPVDGRVSSPFGQRGKRKHQGIDIPMPLGTPIRAAKNGIVARTGNNSTIGFRGYGNFILMDHGGGLQTFYAHCSAIAVMPGQRIMQGQIIGYVGCTGRSTANHLHFEVRINDEKVNPIPYLAGNAKYAAHK